LKKNIAIVAIIFSLAGVACISLGIRAHLKIGAAFEELQNNATEKDRYMDEYVNETMKEIPEFPDVDIQETDRDSLLIKAKEAHQAYKKNEAEMEDWSGLRNIYFALGIPFMMIGLILFLTGRGKQSSVV
jgi:hypothetical protein